MIVIMMGVTGSGKTTVGRCLADQLGWGFVEGDDWHPPENIQKMSQGRPLEDRDRWPWLHNLRQHIEALQQQGQSAVVTCSALKRSYRQVLQPQPDAAMRFVYLKGSAATLHTRLKERQQHFMKADMLDSQLDTLEEPTGAIVVDIDDAKTPAQMAAHVMTQLNLSANSQDSN